MINVGIIGCGFVGGALKDWLEHNNPECKLFISDPAKGYHASLSMTISYIQLISLSVYIVLTKKTLARFIFIEVIISCSTKTAHQDLILSG